MNSLQEDRSLLEVRGWKERCRQEDKDLSSVEDLEKLRKVSDQIKSRHRIQLRKVHFYQ